jgi:hypothetical protein
MQWISDTVFPALKRSAREPDHSPLSVAEFRNECIYTANTLRDFNSCAGTLPLLQSLCPAYLSLCTQKTRSTSKQVNVTVTFWRYIRRVSDSNLDRNCDKPDWGVSWYFSVSPGKCWDSTLNRLRHLPYHQLSFTLPATNCVLCYWIQK